MAKTSLIAIGATIILIMIGVSILQNNVHPSQMHLRPLCFAHQEPSWNICVSCYEKLDDKFENARSLIV